MHLGMGQPVGLDDVEHQGQESIHVPASGHPCAFSLIGLARLDLFASGGIAVAPECFHGFPGLALVIDQIKSHLSSVAAEGGALLGTEAIEFEHGPVTGWQISSNGRLRQFPA